MSPHDQIVNLGIAVMALYGLLVFTAVALYNARVGYCPRCPHCQREDEERKERQRREQEEYAQRVGIRPRDE